MAVVLSIGPLVGATVPTPVTWIDAGLWAAVALCIGLAAQRRSPRGMLAGGAAAGAAVILGSLALVSPTP